MVQQHFPLIKIVILPRYPVKNQNKYSILDNNGATKGLSMIVLERASWIFSTNRGNFRKPVAAFLKDHGSPSISEEETLNFLPISAIGRKGLS
jgi:hypothetical protein